MTCPTSCKAIATAFCHSYAIVASWPWGGVWSQWIWLCKEFTKHSHVIKGSAWWCAFQFIMIFFHLRVYLWDFWPFAKNVMYSVWHIVSNLFDKFCWTCINGIIIFKKLHKIFKFCFQSLHELLNNLAFVKIRFILYMC